LAQEREELRRRAKTRLDKVITRLQKATEEHEALGRRRLQKLRDEALRLEIPGEGDAAGQVEELVAGARVRLALGGQGVLREIRGTRAQVEVSGKRLWVPVAELEVIESPPPAPRARVRVESAEEAPRELNLIGLEGTPSIRIVHGHGAGVLRKMVADVCRSHPAVRSFRHPPQHFGGTGATEIELESDG